MTIVTPRMRVVALRLAFVLSSVAFICPLPIAAEAPATAQTLFDEARLQQSGERNYQRAIEVYEQILKMTDVPAALSMEAQLQWGVCHETLGHTQLAMTAYRSVLSPASGATPDAREMAQDRLTRWEERSAVRIQTVVQESTPVVKIIYAPIPTRWNLDFLRFQYLHTIDTKGSLMSNTSALSPSFAYYIKPGALAIGLTGSDTQMSFGSSSPYGRGLLTIHPHVRVERRWGPFMPYMTAGPSIYRFRFRGSPHDVTSQYDPYFGYYNTTTNWSPEQTATRWTLGAAGELGVAIGSTRGFTLNLGYSLHAFRQVTPPTAYQQAFEGKQGADEANFQNHGLRLIGGPVFSLSFRW